MVVSARVFGKTTFLQTSPRPAWPHSTRSDLVGCRIPLSWRQMLPARCVWFASPGSMSTSVAHFARWFTSYLSSRTRCSDCGSTKRFRIWPKCGAYRSSPRAVPPSPRGPVDLLVTNLRLGPFNGLHSVHLAGLLAIGTRALVYTSRLDIEFGREVQRSGAFYETRRSLPHTLASYVGAALPTHDRRHLGIQDRQRTFRGGRRSADGPRTDRLAPDGTRITGRIIR